MEKRYTEFTEYNNWGSPVQKEIIRQLLRDTAEMSTKESDRAINVKFFGAKGDGVTDDTESFVTAFLTLNEGMSLFIPSGTYILNLNTALPIKDNTTIYGQGWKTIIKNMKDVTLFRANRKATGRTRYFNMKDFSVQAPNNNTFPLIDLTGSSYFNLSNMLLVGDINNMLNNDAIIFPKGLATFNGYINLDYVLIHGFRNGVKGEGNDIHIVKGFYNGNKEYGVHLTPTNVLNVCGTEMSRNGLGGIYAQGTGINIDINWYEYNGWRIPGIHSPNNIEIGPGSKFVSQGHTQRHDPSSVGFIHGKSEDIGFNNGIGTGHNSTYGMLANGNFNLIDDTGAPLGWRKIGDIQSLPITDNTVPKGYGYGRRFQSFSSSGSPKYIQPILKNREEVGKHEGKTITCHVYARVLDSSPANLEYVRFGITKDPLTTGGMSTGSIIKGTQVVVGEWLKYTLQYPIVGNEEQINFGIQLYNNSSIDITGIACQLGELSFANHEKPITSAGGEIYGDLRIHDRILGYASAPPTFGNFKIGDTYLNNNMGVGGNVGFSCVTAGSPGLWKKWGTIT